MRDYSQVAHIRKTIEERLLLGASIQEFLDKMISQAPNTFVELLFEDDPIQHPLFWHTIVQMIPVLEQNIEAERLYLHLVSAVPNGKEEVLSRALQHHPEALWLIDISSVVEQDNMGYQHLMQKRKDRSFLVNGIVELLSFGDLYNVVNEFWFERLTADGAEGISRPGE